MNRAIRTVHLISGLLALPFLAVYFASGVEMAHRTWWRPLPRTSERSLVLPRNLDAREVARRLPIRGELAQVKLFPTGLDLLITQPGVSSLVGYSPSTGEARVHTTTAGALGMLVALHRSKGLWHPYLPLDVWTAVLALMSAALFTLGATGLCLWFQNRAHRTAGLLLLMAGAGIASTLILSMRLS